MKNKELIKNAIKMNNSFVCCGLDPDLNKIPLEITSKNISKEEKVLEFLKNVVDITAPHICSYKIQKAFFDLLSGGKKCLSEIISYIHQEHPNLIVVLDCKVGDIENTMRSYFQNLFDDLKADGILVNPYMGDDIFENIEDYKDKLFFVLCKTSNSGAKIIQNLKLEDGTLVWEKIFEYSINRWNRYKNIIPLISCNEKIHFSKIKIPHDSILFVAGFGTQRGSFENINYLQNYNLMINSSRAILYPYRRDDLSWKEKILDSVIKHKEEFKHGK